MVGLQFLVLSIGVRSPASEPKNSPSGLIFMSFYVIFSLTFNKNIAIVKI